MVPHFDKYSGVLVDIFYDHFLAANWNTYHKISLDIYTQDVYDLMKRNTHHLPEHSKFMLPYMIKANWLYNYGHFEGIQSALNGLSRRTKFNSGMENGVKYLQQNYKLYEIEFAEFFPDIIGYVNTVLLE